MAVSFLSEAAKTAFGVATYASGSSHNSDLCTLSSSDGVTLSGGGNYYLSGNISSSVQFKLTSGNTNVCLNGKTVENDVSNGLFRAENSTLNIYDCVGGGTIHAEEAHNPVYLAGGNLNLYGGTLKSDSRATIATEGDGTIRIYGGTVQGGSSGVNVGGETQNYNIYISGGNIKEGTSYAVNNKGTGTIHLSGAPQFTERRLK